MSLWGLYERSSPPDSKQRWLNRRLESRLIVHGPETAGKIKTLSWINEWDSNHGIIGIACVIAIIYLAIFISAISYKNIEVYKSARSYLENYFENEQNSNIENYEIGYLPKAVQILNNEGFVVQKVIIDGEKKFVQLHLRKENGNWVIVNYKNLETVKGNSYSIQYKKKM